MNNMRKSHFPPFFRETWEIYFKEIKCKIFIVSDKLFHNTQSTICTTFQEWTIIYIFLFLLNNIFIAANKPNKKRNKTGFMLYSALNSPEKGLIASIRNIQQNIRENIVQCLVLLKQHYNFVPN